MLYFLLAAIGVVLLLPTGTKKTSEETEQPQETAARPAGDAGLSVQEEMEQRLCDALSQMDGVGAVHVVVTLESTGKRLWKKMSQRGAQRRKTRRERRPEALHPRRRMRQLSMKRHRTEPRHRMWFPRSTRRCAACSLSQKAGKPGDDTGDSGGRDGIISGGRK